MEVRPLDYSAKALYKLMIGTIVPRPIAWVSSLTESGSVNLAPFSFFNGVCSNPPTVSLSFSWNPAAEDHCKDTLRNIRRRGECVVHMVDQAHAEAMNLSAGDFPPDVSELEYVGLQTLPPATGSTPRIAGTSVSFECTLLQEVDVGEGPGSATLVLATIKHMHIADHVINERLYVDVHSLDPVGRLAGNEYCVVRDVFRLDRPAYADLT
ncbi:MAG: flavin reductase family protein [Spirochaetia bacterium]